mgnify:CR=1 FL=1
MMSLANDLPSVALCVYGGQTATDSIGQCCEKYAISRIRIRIQCLARTRYDTREKNRNVMTPSNILSR